MDLMLPEHFPVKHPSILPVFNKIIAKQSHSKRPTRRQMK
jgi:hypothetical protein